MRMILIGCGIISLLTFLIPNIGFDKKIIDTIKTNIDYNIFFWSCIACTLTPLALIVAFSIGGPMAGVPKNMNLVFLLILSVLFLKDKPKLDASVIIGVIIYSLVGMFIEWRNVILKNH